MVQLRAVGQTLHSHPQNYTSLRFPTSNLNKQAVHIKDTALDTGYPTQHLKALVKPPKTVYCW